MTAAPRLSAPDTLRGWSLLSMCAYHACWDAVYLFDRPWGWYGSFWAYVWQQSICWSFILLAGFCHGLGRRPVRRSVTVLLCGGLVSAVSGLLSPQTAVRFGILTFLGAAGLIAAVLRPWLRRVPPRLGLGGSFALFVLLKDVPQGYLGFAGQAVCPVPRQWYSSALTAFLGFPPGDFASSDYFPLLPWLCLYGCGVFLLRLTPGEGRPRPAIPAVAALGRRSLWVYLLHQPVLYALLRVWFSR